MKRILIPTRDAGDWARLLAQPEKHWKRGRSAMSLAACWEAASPHLPAEVRGALDGAASPELLGLSPVFVVPEFEVPLPGGQRASQTDIMVLARNTGGTVAIGVEGKVNEPFGGTLGDKRKEASPGVTERLAFLHEQLGVSAPLDDGIRYQLLHRTASAVLFAEEVHARAAVMLVHSFSPEGTGFEDFVAFATALGADARKDAVVPVTRAGGTPVFLGWVRGEARFTAVEIARP